MHKHAYCIIAHNDKYCLTKLVALLDDSRNDIFLLIDKKTSTHFTDELQTSKSRLFIIKYDKRVDIRWGDISQIKAEFVLFEEAVNTDKYDYIHLISGSDLPLKTQRYIHDFFDREGKNQLFITIGEDLQSQKKLQERLSYYQIFTKHQSSKNLLLKVACNVTNKSIKIFQKIFHIKRKWGDYALRKGSQWVSITDEFARYLIERKNFILKKYRYIKCVDEIFIQSEAYNSPYRNSFYRNDQGLTDNMRNIMFNGSHARIKTMKDYSSLISSADLFARKFSSVHDKEIIKKIFDYINSSSTSS